MGYKVVKVLLVLSILWVIIVVGGSVLYVYITSPPAFTDEQCEVVEQNFDKLKVGMTKEQVIPLIGGERKVSAIYNPGNFPGDPPDEFLSEQKTPWEVWGLCNTYQKSYEWYFIAFDTKTNKVVKIFSGPFDRYGFD